MTTFPSLFISHGSPNLPLHACPAREFLIQLGAELGKPTAILVLSPHWLTAKPTVSTALEMKAVHDFGGFSQELYEMTYPAPGAPELAEQVSQRLTEAGFEATTDAYRALDHGAWVPLKLMYPEADVPVTQLSLQYRQGPDYQLELGRALAPLRDEGVLIVASGSATHNLRRIGGHGPDDGPPDWVVAFDQWVQKAIARHDLEALLDYRQQAPYAVENHPTDEHLLPLFVALGAGDATPGRQLHSSYTYGVLSMAAYAFA